MGNQVKESITPPETALAGGISEGVRNGTDRLNKRLSRLSQAKTLQITNRCFIEASLQKNNYTNKSSIVLAKSVSKLRFCANDLQFRHYPSVDEYKLVGLKSCDQHLLCPFCAIRRGSKYCAKYMDRLNEILKSHPNLMMSHMVLTIKNGEDLFERSNHLLKGYQIIRQRIKDALRGLSNSEFRKIKGYVGAFEITNEGNGYHPHMHFLILHDEPIYTTIMQNEWQGITKDSWNIHVSAVHDHVKGFVEVFKYALKFSTMRPEHVVEAYLTMKGRRLVVSGGLFYGVKVPEDLTDDDPYEEMQYNDFFYKFLSRAGYSLHSYEINTKPEQ